VISAMSTVMTSSRRRVVISVYYPVARVQLHHSIDDLCDGSSPQVIVGKDC